MKKVYSLLALFVASSSTYAASETNVWSHDMATIPAIANVGSNALKASPSAYLLKPIGQASSENLHQRYQLTYKGIPVWGKQIIVHRNHSAKPLITGVQVKGIESDLDHTEGQYSAAEAEQKILTSIKNPIKFKKIEKIIFIDDQKKAHLAYHLSFYTKEGNAMTAPHYIIDADSNKILNQWNGLHEAKLGQGMGGNTFVLPYRQGSFQYGGLYPDQPSFEKFDVRTRKGKCYVENPSVRVISLLNMELGYDAFPITVADEKVANLNAFSYRCSKKTKYLNATDNDQAPINYAFSPINDTMFFAQQTLDMYTNQYHLVKPLGKDLPIRAFAHLGKMDNAFAIGTIVERGKIVAHQQIVIGNGDEFFSAPAQSVIAHELSHNFTDLHSQLIYQGQSGGMNESFSDMAAIALQDYLRITYPWYWDGKDWALGREATIGAVPLRYMDEPTKDGSSIDHASNYRRGLNVHYSSGVYNKAFYLLSNQPGWSIAQAFQVMIDANQNYWIPNTTFDLGACGVIQAATDRDFDPEAVVKSFADVGVYCEMSSAHHH